jgi:hypothetical protein
LTDYEQGLCPQCRQPYDESASPDSDPDTGTWRYEVGPPHRCHACTAVSAASEKYEDAKHGRALSFIPRRVLRAVRNQ